MLHFLCYKQSNRQKLQFIGVMHLSAAIPGGEPREPPVICITTFTNSPNPKPKLFNKKLLTPLAWGQRSVPCQVKRCNISKEFYLP